MICIIVVAGHGTLLEGEILNDTSGQYTELINIPKALLPAQSVSSSGKKILDYWWDLLKSRQQFKEVYLVTNADKYKHYERWASANEFPVNNIINDGSTTISNSLGAIADLELVLKSKNIQDNILVVAGDMLFDRNFDIEQLIDYFKHKKDNLAIYYDLEEDVSTENRGIIEIDNTTGKFLEKPKPHETPSRLSSPVFYCLCKSTLPLISEYTSTYRIPKERSFGCFMSWLVSNGHTVYGMKLPTRFQLIGQVHFKDYLKIIEEFTNKQIIQHKQVPITCRTYARVGLMGNPSDGFNGKTISVSIKNFWADVTISPSSNLKLHLHPLHDPTEFGSLSDLHGISKKEGYLGGLRLLQSTCKRFYQYCYLNGIALAQRNFSLSYETNIPRQVGLAGSSAIIASTLKCLMKFFNLSDKDIPKPLQPQFILDVEMQELFIQAGLQDRVIQIYEGMVYMDFDKEIMDSQGYVMNVHDLPSNMWLAYIGDPSDSGKIHSNIKQRWLQGDKEVIEAMKQFGHLTDQAKAAIENKDYEILASLMNQNFELRRKIYTAEALGELNLKMIEISRKYGSAAKFCGSGGAIVGLCFDEDKKYKMMQEFRMEGFVFCDIQLLT